MDEHKEELLQEAEAAENPAPKQKGRGMSRVTYYALIGIFTAVFLLCGVYLGGYFYETGSTEKEYDALASIYQQGIQNQNSTPSTVPTRIPGNVESSGSAETQPPVILPELQPIYELNDDLVGYLNFPNSSLNLRYPVLQSPEDDDFYLSHDFYGAESIVGCPYVPAGCDVFEPSDNVVIYGHNLRTGGMFNKLTYYRNKSYWEKNQTFSFDTLYERHTYQIFAVFKTAAKQYKDDGTPWGYPYHRLNDFATKEAFDKFIADVKGAAFTSGEYQGWTFYDTGITPQYGDKLLCLSTCEYTMKDPDGTTNGRWVIMAVRIDED